MPVRIYDLAKKLGIESKEVLAKAKDLGISQAKVPSSSLDKITAEFLEQHLAPPLPPPPPPVIAAPAEIIAPAILPQVAPVFQAPPPEVLLPPPVLEAPPAPVAVEVPPLPQTVVSPVIAEGVPETISTNVIPPPPVVEAPKVAAPPSPPPPPAVPKIGDKVGFVQLAPKPAPRQPQPSGRPAPSGPPQGRPDFQRRGDIRGVRGAPAPPSAQPLPGQKLGQRPAQKPAGPAPAPGKPEKFVAPVTGQVIILKPPTIVRDLADELNRKPFQIIADLMEVGVFANVNQSIEEDVAHRICG